MSVYIDMEMPASCYKCPMGRRNGMDLVCPIAHERFSVADVNILEYRLDNCPLAPVPTPHGRLIDADKIYDAVEQRYRISSGIEHRCERDLLDLICSALTTIPAEEAE